MTSYHLLKDKQNKYLCGLEQWKLVCLISRRSGVRISYPQFALFMYCHIIFAKEVGGRAERI